jgi:hypothetical protein
LTGELAKVQQGLAALNSIVQAMQDELDGRFAKALTMLANSG